MTISIGSTHASTISNNVSSQPSSLRKALRSLVLGAAFGLGTLAPTTSAVAQEKPPENVPVQEKPRQEEQRPRRQPSSTSKWVARALGATAGAAYALLRLRSEKNAQRDSGAS